MPAVRKTVQRTSVPPVKHQNRVAIALTLLTILVAVSAAHWQVLSSQALSLDDNELITYNPLVRNPSWSSARQFMVEVGRPSTVRGYYQPLSMISLMIDYSFGGRPDDLSVFHRVNLTLHLLSTTALFFLLLRLFNGLIPAAGAALLFGLHPLTVEPVAWVGERKTLLATLMAILCLLAYLEHCRRGGWKWMATATLFYALALLSKPTIVMLPILFFIIDYLTHRKWSRAIVWEKLPSFALGFVSAVIAFISQKNTSGAVVAGGNIPEFALRALYLPSFYVSQIIWPFNISCVYQLPEPWSLANARILLGVLLTVGITATTIVLIRKARIPVSGWFFFLIALAPTLGFVQYTWNSACDKYVYWPGIGLVFVVAWMMSLAWNAPYHQRQQTRWICAITVMALAVGEIFLTRRALANWSDTYTLFQHMLVVAPDAPPVHSQLGILLAQKGRTVEAINHLEKALAAAPDYADAHYNLGIILAEQNQIPQAISHFEQACQLSPLDPEPRYNLGAALALANRHADAIPHFKRALQLAPHSAAAKHLLGKSLIMTGDLPGGIRELQSSLVDGPQNAQVHYRLASALLLAGQTSAAIEHLEKALQLNPDWVEPMNNLGWLRSTSSDPQIRNPDQAIRFAERADSLTRHSNPGVLDTLAAAYASAERFDEAVATARSAIGLLPPEQKDLANEIGKHLALYAKHQPLMETASRPTTSQTQ